MSARYAGCLTIDGSTTPSDQVLDGPGSADGRGRRWIEFGWQPLGAPDSDGDDATRPRHVPEVYVTDHRAARILSALLAVGVAIGTIFWWFAATDRFDVPSMVCAGCAPPEWFRWLQLIVAMVGIVVAVVQVVYFLNFAVRGVVWRRWRGVAIAFGTLAGAYTLLWWIGRVSF